MSIAIQYVTLQDLVKELKQTLPRVLEIMRDIGIQPIFPLPPEADVYYTSLSSILSRKSERQFSPIKTLAVHIKDAEFIFMSNKDLGEIYKNGFINLSIVDSIYAESLADEEHQPTHSKNAKIQEIIDSAKNYGLRMNPNILLPCFALFFGATPPSQLHQGVCAFEDINKAPGLLIRLGDLRISPEDENLLRRLAKKSTAPSAPAQLPTDGAYISKQFRQLLEIFNEYQKRADKEQDLHKILQDCDPEKWQSETLRNHAIKLIAPTPPKKRSTNRSPYDSDGIPIKLSLLLGVLKDLHLVIPNPSTEQYKQELTVASRTIA